MLLRSYMKKASLFVALTTVVSCGDFMSLDEASEENGRDDSAIQTDKFISIDVNVAEDTSSLNLLAAATSYSIDLDGCVSGHTATATDASSGLKVYKFDQGCLAKLTQFVANGITWVPDVNFTTWAAGDTATFMDQAINANKISVSVSEQLDDPISGTENVTYLFSEIVAGADNTVVEATVADSHTMAVNGQGAPDFTITSIDFSGMTAAGAGQFIFHFDCAIAQTGTGATTACRDVNLSELTYKLVEDTYGGTLTMADAQALFPAGETAVNTATDIHTVGNGGFNSAVVDGPAPISAKSNMILILQAADLSYLYFNVDVATITQD